MGKHKDKKSKKNKKEKKHKKKERKRSSSSSSNSEDEWVEKESIVQDKNEQNYLERESWMSLSTSFNSFSNIDRRLHREESKRTERENATYDPRKSTRELNPYWKGGGDGLPLSNFKKPYEDDDNYYQKDYSSQRSYANSELPRRSSSSNWRKQPEVTNEGLQTTPEESEKFLSDSEMNALAAKLVKAEIMGNVALIYELREKLEAARKARENKTLQEQTIILTETDCKGLVRPLKLGSEYGEYSGGKHKKQKIETHKDGERVRYFPDDDKYSLKQMFENEHFASAEDEQMEFARIAGRIGKNDDLDDLFADNIRRKESDRKADKRSIDKAIRDHQLTMQSLENCNKCLQSESMPKHLMVSMGETMYLTLPPHEPLMDGHCLIIPTRHVSCCTNLEENEWSELMDFRRTLVRMFADRNSDVIFFETAMFLSRQPHMSLQCVPLPKEQGDLAPIYFKKAIDESEMEWSSNKKLVSLAGRDIRRAIPKGLPYFSVSFGMEEGFAHVIEDQRLFPTNFGQEIIGGMLDLHHSKWKKPKRQNFSEQKERVLQFSREWSKYDFTAGSVQSQ